VSSLYLSDFRCYHEVDVEFPSGCTVVTGANGQGKTSLLEGITWAATGRSLRGVPDAVLVAHGADAAIVRVGVNAEERRRRIEAEIPSSGRSRVLVDGNRITRVADRVGVLRTTVFSPDDLMVVKGGPSLRRDLLDGILTELTPRFAATRRDLERVLRQRNALLKSRARDSEAIHTLDVFDRQLTEVGGAVVAARLDLVRRLEPHLVEAYRALAEADTPVRATYASEWLSEPADPAGSLADALAAARGRERDRGVTLVGPQRDDLDCSIGGLASRTHASQGEQRTLALALRLGGHRLVAADTDDDPVLLLDDVFSELDDRRAAALVEHLPAGQTIVTTAGRLPEGIAVDRHVVAGEGHLEDVA